MCAAKNYRRIARSFTPFGPVTLGPATAGPAISPITLDESGPPISAQVVVNQTQAAVAVLRVTEELQSLTLDGPMQGIDFGINQAAATASIPVVQNEAQESGRTTMSLDAHTPFVRIIEMLVSRRSP